MQLDSTDYLLIRRFPSQNLFLANLSSYAQKTKYPATKWQDSFSRRIESVLNLLPKKKTKHVIDTNNYKLYCPFLTSVYNTFLLFRKTHHSASVHVNLNYIVSLPKNQNCIWLILKKNNKVAKQSSQIKVILLLYLIHILQKNVEESDSRNMQC